MKFIKKRPTRFFAYIFLSLLVSVLGGYLLRLNPDARFSLENRKCLSKPKFADYPVQTADVYTKEPAYLDLSSSREAQAYRSFIKLAASRGVNFAGKYVVAEWGCGADCQNHAIINVQSGRLIAYGQRSAYGVEFYKDSRLIIFNPRHGIIRDLYSAPIAKTAYYLIDNGKLVPLCE